MSVMGSSCRSCSIYDQNQKLPLSLLFKSLISKSENASPKPYSEILSRITNIQNTTKPDRAGVNQYRPYYFNYGRHALYWLLKNLGYKGKKIIFPAFICPYLPQAAVLAGAEPVFVDVSLDDFCLEMGNLEESLENSSVAAVFGVHTLGIPCNIQKILSLQTKHGFRFIEDNAHALFAKTGDKYTGQFGDDVLFSFYKQLPNLPGALLASKYQNDTKTTKTKPSETELSQNLDILTSIKTLLRITEGPHQLILNAVRKTTSLPVQYNGFDVPGNVNPISANTVPSRIFVLSLDSLDKEIAQRRNVAGYYQKRVIESSVLSGPSIIASQKPSWLNFTVRLRPNLSKIRDSLLINLRREGIFCTRLWYDSPVLLPQFAKAIKISASNSSTTPNAILLAQTAINLPISSVYTEEDVDFIFGRLESHVKMLAR